MARKSLRPQLNQIRAWVRQGRTDAWIAHQLGVPASQLRDFRHQHGLTAEGEEPGSDVDLRDEIEAEIEAELGEPEPEQEPEQEEGATDEDEAEGERGKERSGGRRRRRRRGGRGRGRKKPLEATFDQGEEEGYGIWLDPAIKDDPTYAEHWAGRRALKVTIEPERIVLERVED
jgi:transposase-like protein